MQRTGNMSHIRPLPLPNNQPKHDAHDHLRAVFSLFFFFPSSPKFTNESQLCPIWSRTQPHSLLRPMINSNRITAGCDINSHVNFLLHTTPEEIIPFTSVGGRPKRCYTGEF
jgi:hypothetical protein